MARGRRRKEEKKCTTGHYSIQAGMGKSLLLPRPSRGESVASPCELQGSGRGQPSISVSRRAYPPWTRTSGPTGSFWRSFPGTFRRIFPVQRNGNEIVQARGRGQGVRAHSINWRRVQGRGGQKSGACRTRHEKPTMI